MRASTCVERITTRRGDRERSAVSGQRSAVSRHSSSTGGRRSRFKALRRRLLSARRRRAPAVVAVGNRTTASRKASRSISSSRRRAMARLRHCERVSAADTVTMPPAARGPSRASSRLRTSSPNAVLAAASHDNSTRVADRLACCPPGPPEVSKRHCSSSGGMANHSPTRTGAVDIT